VTRSFKVGYQILCGVQPFDMKPVEQLVKLSGK
jgi:hypothetical protein